MRLTDRVVRDWFLDFLLEHDVELEYWDVVEALHGTHAEVGEVAAPYLRRFGSLQEIDRALARSENAAVLFVMLLSYSHPFTPIYRLVSKHGRCMAYIDWGDIPSNRAPRWRKALQSYASPLWVLSTAYHQQKLALLRRTGLVAPFLVKFAAGRTAMSRTGDAVRVIAINAIDYDLYLSTLAHPNRLVDGRYAVFLDINLPYQSDLALLGMQSVDAAPYFASLNRFFGLLEATFRVQVVIAAHPKAGYGSETFEGRTTIRGQTAALVRDCEFVVSHTSTSFSYAVLNDKPVLFAYTDEMRRLYQNTVMRQLHSFAEYLDASVCNVDMAKDASHLRLKPVAAERYAQYKYDFLTSRDSEGIATRDIFLREVAAATSEPILITESSK